ncbi:MAG: hypothetical protein QM775_08890 [Pirellulales bacterium]
MSDDDKSLHIPPKIEPDVAPAVQDDRDIDIQAIGRFLVSMVIGLALVAGATYGYVRIMQRDFENRRPPPEALAGERTPPPSPYLQPSLEDDRTPAQTMRAVRETQEAELRKLAWADDKHEFVQLPIDRAIQIVARDGLPKWRLPRNPKLRRPRRPRPPVQRRLPAQLRLPQRRRPVRAYCPATLPAEQGGDHDATDSLEPSASRRSASARRRGVGVVDRRRAGRRNNRS